MMRKINLECFDAFDFLEPDFAGLVPKVPRAKNGSIIVRLVKKNRKNKVELERDSNSISEDCTFLA